MHLEPIFDLELLYTGPVPPDTPGMGRIGEPVGGGKGSVAGSRLRGSVRWTLFENRNPKGICDANHVGVIETDDGARIQFATLGYYRRADRDKWMLTAAVKFDTDATRYQWLNLTAGILQGEFDMQTGRTRARAYTGLSEGAETSVGEETWRRNLRS